MNSKETAIKPSSPARLSVPIAPPPVPVPMYSPSEGSDVQMFAAAACAGYVPIIPIQVKGSDLSHPEMFSVSTSAAVP